MNTLKIRTRKFGEAVEPVYWFPPGADTSDLLQARDPDEWWEENRDTYFGRLTDKGHE